MKAPDIIYTDGMNTCATLPVFSNIDSNIKYIRADLAELNWIDVREILKLANEVEQENDALPILKSELCDEVLRRFLESKRDVEL